MKTPFVSLSLLLILAPAALASPLPGAPRCPVFPRDDAWNQRVDRLPVAPGSACISSSIRGGDFEVVETG